jgi:hypothetical protein
MATGVQMGVRKAPSGVSVSGLPDPPRGPWRRAAAASTSWSSQPWPATIGQMTSTTHDSTEAARQPRTAVFEHAAVLLASAQALEAAAGEPGAETALGPMLACLDLSLDALAHAVEQLRRNALEPVTRSETDREIRFAVTEAAQQFGALVAVLADCRDACILAGSSVAPIQGELTAR